MSGRDFWGRQLRTAAGSGSDSRYVQALHEIAEALFPGRDLPPLGRSATGSASPHTDAVPTDGDDDVAKGTGSAARDVNDGGACSVGGSGGECAWQRRSAGWWWSGLGQNSSSVVEEFLARVRANGGDDAVWLLLRTVTCFPTECREIAGIGKGRFNWLRLRKRGEFITLALDVAGVVFRSLDLPAVRSRLEDRGSSQPPMSPISGLGLLVRLVCLDRSNDPVGMYYRIALGIAAEALESGLTRAEAVQAAEARLISCLKELPLNMDELEVLVRGVLEL